MADEKKESLKLQQQEFKDSLAKNKVNTLEKIKELKGTSPRFKKRQNVLQILLLD
jgi:hypothetical protein